jgi:hypothetical protein
LANKLTVPGNQDDAAANLASNESAGAAVMLTIPIK